MIVVQFSMSFFRDSRFWLFSLSAVRHQLIYYITFAVVCQEVFETFLKFFQKLLISNFLVVAFVFSRTLAAFFENVFHLSLFSTAFVNDVPSFNAAFILYHIGFALSSGFAKLFEVFFEAFRFRSVSLRRLDYYTTSLPFCQPLLTKFFGKIEKSLQAPSGSSFAWLYTLVFPCALSWEKILF